MLVLYHSRQFAMSHGSYDSNLGSEILILVGDIMSRSWPNIDLRFIIESGFKSRAGYDGTRTVPQIEPTPKKESIQICIGIMEQNTKQ